MLKSAAASLLVFAIVTVSLVLPVTAQQQVPAKETTAKNDETVPNFNKVFAVETARIKADSEVFDPVKTDRENSNQQAQKKGWSTTKKVLVISAIAVGVAALVFLIAKYGKDCIRSEPANCTPTVDEPCVCLEYERRNP